MVEDLMPDANELLAACKPIPDVDKAAYKVGPMSLLFFSFFLFATVNASTNAPFFQLSRTWRRA